MVPLIFFKRSLAFPILLFPHFFAFIAEKDFLFFFLILFYFKTLHNCINFAKYQNESATGIHVRKTFLSLFAILWNSAFKWVYLSISPLPFASFLSSGIWKTSSDNHFAFLFFFFLGMVLITASYTMSRISIHSSSGTLFIRSNPLNLFVTSTI